MDKIPHPHDRFFRGALSRLEVAQGLLKKHLPKEILDLLDLEALEPMKESFIEDDLSEVVTDVLLKTHINGEPGYVYLLFEHWSKPDPLTPLRLLIYITRILKYHTDNHGAAKLPAVIPVVFYNAPRPYPYSKNVFSLFGPQEALMRKILLHDFNLIDFGQIPDEVLLDEVWSGVVSLAMKHIYSDNILEAFESIKQVISELEKSPSGRGLITLVLKYVMQRHRSEDDARFYAFLKSTVSKETGENVMSLARKWQEEGRQEGRKEGRQEGREEAKREFARSLLLQKDPMPIQNIATLVKLPEKTILEIQQKISSSRT